MSVSTVSPLRGASAADSPDDWHDALLAMLASDGIAITHGVTVAELKSLLDQRAVIFDHPDADAEGVTVIAPKQADAGGFSRHRLVAHTDRAMVPRPPSVLVLVMHEPATAGGDAFFIDGYQVVRTLLGSGLTPMELRSIRLRARDDSTSVPMFEQTPPGTWVIRYRDDEVARPDSPYEGVTDRLDEALASNVHYRTLSAGDGYVLNNRRWLHGRTSFTGERRASRLLYSTAINDNFAAAGAIPELGR